MDSFLVQCFALVLLAAILALGTVPHARAGQRDYVVNLAAPGEFNLISFHESLSLDVEQRSDWNQAADQAPQHNLLGVRFSSPLPVVGATSSVEYAWSRNDLSAVVEQQMVQFSIQHQLQDVRYGLKYFDVGSEFGTDPLARRTLTRHSLGKASQGGEFWVSWSLEDLSIEPRVQRTQNMDRLLVRLEHPLFQLDWQARDQFADTGHKRQSTFTQELSGAFKLLQETGDLPSLNLGWKLRKTEGWESEINRVEANLQLRKDVLYQPYLGRGASVDATINYRREEQAHSGITEQGFGVNLTIRLDVGAG